MQGDITSIVIHSIFTDILFYRYFLTSIKKQQQQKSTTQSFSFKLVYLKEYLC